MSNIKMIEKSLVTGRFPYGVLLKQLANHI